MSKSIDTLAKEAMDLPSDQRLALANRILTSVEPEASPQIEAEWDAEIRERIRRLDSEGVVPVPAAEAFATVKRRLGA